MSGVPGMANVGIVAKSHLHQATPHLIEVESWLAVRGHETVFETATAMLMPTKDGRTVADKPALVTRVDLVLVLGGDGTLLSVADCIGAAGVDVPILGVNFGGLGFLTEATLPELYPSLEAALSGRTRIEERMMLHATTVREGATLPEHHALNDVVITKAARARMTDLCVSLGDEFVTRVKADGLIVATPTGSTAYSFSARGPIVTPTVPCMVITPIAAHMVFDRSFVLDAGQRVTIDVVGEEMGLVSADGREALELPVGSRLLIGAAERRARLVRRDDAPEFLSLVREKFGLPGEPDPGVGGAG